ncbi:hypothetical protein M5D96_003804, partial [Drosophila gunungcola]
GLLWPHSKSHKLRGVAIGQRNISETRLINLNFMEGAKSALVLNETPHRSVSLHRHALVCEGITKQALLARKI